MGERSRIVTAWPRRLRTIPVRRPPKEPPTIIALLEVDMTQSIPDSAIRGPLGGGALEGGRMFA